MALGWTLFTAAGLNFNSSFPALGMTQSVARYLKNYNFSDKKVLFSRKYQLLCLVPKRMTTDYDGFLPRRPRCGTFLQSGWCRSVTSTCISACILKIKLLEFGYFFIGVRWIDWPLTRASSSVIIGHFTPTLYFRIAFATFTVTENF